MENLSHPNNHVDGLGVQEELADISLRSKDNPPPANQLYDKFYYQNCCGGNLPYTRTEPHWLKFFGEIASKIVNQLGPSSVLDAGCAHGFLVESLRDQGVEAYGIDISEYAISQVRPDIQPFCRVASLLEPLPRRYDLIICIEVLEHLSPAEAEKVVENFAQATDDILFSSTPDDYAEPTHQNVQEPAYWAALFARFGFQHDLDFDASFITGWAMRFRKSKETLPSFVQTYERQLWRANHQLQVLRRQLLNSRNEKAEKEQALKQQQAIQAELQTAYETMEKLKIEAQISQQTSQKLEAELQESRQAQTATEQELARQQQRTEEALNGFKVAQVRFRQMERERDQQIQAVEQLTAQLQQATERMRELEYQESQAQRRIRHLEHSVEGLNQVRQHTNRHDDELTTLQNYTRRLEEDREVMQQNLARFEQDLRALQATRTVRAASAVSNLVGGPLRLLKGMVRGPLEGGLDLPTPESTAESIIHVAGWAYSTASRVSEVMVYLDDKLVGKIDYGTLRPDVAANRPWQLVVNCGFEAKLELDRELFREGSYTLKVEVSDLSGNRQTYTRPVVVAHPSLTPATASTTLLSPFSYEQWIVRNEPDTAELEAQRHRSVQLGYRPLFSILTPVYNTPPTLLQAAIESVLNQTYDKWELCLVNGASSNPQVQDLLESYARQDRRIRVQALSRNEGISGNTNAALAMAGGEFIALLDHDDELSPNALYEAAVLLNAHPEADMVYSDEDKYDPQGLRCLPFFKPDWSFDLLRSQMYTCHLGIYRTELIRRLGGFRSQFDGAQDYDLVLRIAEQTEQIYHIPRILYHWRMSENSTASGVQAKNYAASAQLRAVDEHCRRLGLKAMVEPGLVPHTLRVRRILTDYPKISIIIPTRDQPKLVQQCIESIRATSTYPNYEILLVDNDSQEEESLEYFRELKAQPGIRVLSYPKPFNFSAINNFAAAQAEGELLLLLNNDIEVISPHWLEVMVEHALRPEVGAVGAKLLYPDGRLQHAGIIIGIGGVAGHSHKYLPVSEPGYFSRTMVIQNLSAVTGACMMVRAEVYREVGGLDEKNLAVAFNDVDFCLRLREKGYLLVWTPYAELYHHESISRGQDTEPEKALRFQREVEYMFRRWKKTLDYDPYYNLNLTLETEDFSIAPVSRVTNETS